MNAKVFHGKYEINDINTFTVNKTFDVAQHQMKFAMKNNFQLDDRTFLSKVNIFKKRKTKPTSLHLKQRNIIVKVDEDDNSFLKLIDASSEKLISRFQPYTGHNKKNNFEQKLNLYSCS